MPRQTEPVVHVTHAIASGSCRRPVCYSFLLRQGSVHNDTGIRARKGELSRKLLRVKENRSSASSHVHQRKACVAARNLRVEVRISCLLFPLLRLHALSSVEKYNIRVHVA